MGDGGEIVPFHATGPDRVEASASPADLSPALDAVAAALRALPEASRPLSLRATISPTGEVHVVAYVDGGGILARV